MRSLASLARPACLAVLAGFTLMPAPALAQGDKPKVLQVAGPEAEPDAKPRPDPIKVAGPEPGPKPAQVAGDEAPPPAGEPRLLIGTSILGVGFSHSSPLGVEGGATVFEGRIDFDYVGREKKASVRGRLELAIGGGSRLTGTAGGALLAGLAGSLSPGKYIFARAGAEGFYQQRPWGYTGVINAPKLELGVGLAPVALSGPTFFQKLAMDVALSGGLALGAWAGDEDPALDSYKRTLSASFGGTAHIAVPGVSLRADYLRVQSDESLSLLRIRPCFGAVFFAACIDGELSQGAFASASDGAITERSIVSIGVSVGLGIAWWEPQVPSDLPPDSR